MLTILVTNRKGGVGKTTTSLNLSACFAKRGLRTLVVDLDTQGHVQYGLGFKKPFEKNIHESIQNKISLHHFVVKSKHENLSFIPAGINSITRYDKINKKRLKKLLKPLSNDYDICIIDTAPTNDSSLQMALCAADFVLIPMQTEFLGLMGAIQFLKLFYTTASKLNTNFKLLGIVPTMFMASIKERNAILKELTDTVGQKRVLPAIRKDAKLSSAFCAGVPASLLDEHSRGKEDYENLCEAVLLRLGIDKK